MRKRIEVSGRPASRLGRILRTIAWALFIAFVFGFLIGTWIRKQLEEPVRYIGGRESPAQSIAYAGLPTRIVAARPGDIGHADAGILVSRQHEEQIGQTIQISD